MTTEWLKNVNDKYIKIVKNFNSKNHDTTSLYLLIFNILTDNNESINYTDNEKNVMFHLNSIDSVKIKKMESLIDDLLEKHDNYYNKQEDSYKKVLESYSKTISYDTEKDINEYIVKNNIHSTNLLDQVSIKIKENEESERDDIISNCENNFDDIDEINDVEDYDNNQVYDENEIDDSGDYNDDDLPETNENFDWCNEY